MLLASLKKLDAKGRHETDQKCRSFASRGFRYGVATGRCNSGPPQLLQGALITPKARHYAAIPEPAKLGQLLRAIEGFSYGPLALAPFVRGFQHVVEGRHVRVAKLAGGEDELAQVIGIAGTLRGWIRDAELHRLSLPRDRRAITKRALYPDFPGAAPSCPPCAAADREPASTEVTRVLRRGWRLHIVDCSPADR
jgi:hypothetical protein